MGVNKDFWQKKMAKTGATRREENVIGVLEKRFYGARRAKALRTI
jgi:hypothetical protein